MIKNKIQDAALSVSEINLSLKSVTKFSWMAAGVFFVTYLYLVGAITFSVIKQESLANAIKMIVSQTSKEELMYLNLQKDLTESYAKERGYVSATSISYATAPKSFAWNTGQQN